MWRLNIDGWNALLRRLVAEQEADLDAKLLPERERAAMCAAHGLPVEAIDGDEAVIAIIPGHTQLYPQAGGKRKKAVLVVTLAMQARNPRDAGRAWSHAWAAFRTELAAKVRRVLIAQCQVSADKAATLKNDFDTHVQLCNQWCEWCPAQCAHADILGPENMQVICGLSPEGSAPTLTYTGPYVDTQDVRDTYYETYSERELGLLDNALKRDKRRHFLNMIATPAYFSRGHFDQHLAPVAAFGGRLVRVSRFFCETCAAAMRSRIALD